MESWLKVSCPNCKKANWICQGDLSDCTYPDVEGVECFSCKHQFVLDEYEQSIKGEDEDVYYETGMEKPN